MQVPTVAFVPQSGGSLAAWQVGMLRALLEAGIRPEIMVGSSAGALNAAATGEQQINRYSALRRRLCLHPFP